MNSFSYPVDFDVIVVGGGLVGSLASLYFAQKGCRVTLIEKRQDIRKTTTSAGKSINLALSVRGMESLRKVGIDITQKIAMRARMIHSGGKLTSQAYGINNECIYSVDRKLINEILLDKCEKLNVNILFETGLDQIDFDTMSLSLLRKGKQSKISGNLIIGADGAYSRVRTQMQRVLRMDYAQEYIDHGYVELSMPPRDGDYAMDPGHLHIWPQKTFMMIALPNMDKSFTVTLFMPFKNFEKIKTPADLLLFFQTYFADSIDKIGIDLLVKDYFDNPKGSLISIKTKPYNFGGKCVIVGDAAHAMVPFYGQGMNCGFEDILVLSTILETHQAKSELSNQILGVHELEKVFTEFSDLRSIDAMAMCDLALHNYIEMRSDVLSRTYLFRKSLESFLTKLFPRYVVPLYSMVSFSRIRYSVALQRYNTQTLWFERFLTTVKWISVGGLGMGIYGILRWKKFL